MPKLNWNQYNDYRTENNLEIRKLHFLRYRSDVEDLDKP